MTEAHPLETWGQPTGEERVHRALPDSGYLDASPVALKRMADDLAYIRSLPPVKHQSVLDAERRSREDSAEADRRNGPDPRAVLHQAHALHAMAASEVERLAPLVQRARDLVADLEDRQRRHEAETESVRIAAATALIAAITTGEPAPLSTPPLDRVVADAIADELGVALAAAARLEGADRAARDLLEQRRHGVSRCALAVMVADAADLGDEIIAADEQLAARRADLDALARLISNEGRRLNRVQASMPASISRALSPVDTVLHGTDRTPAATDWLARYRDLCEVPIGSVSDTLDTPETEPQQSSL